MQRSLRTVALGMALLVAAPGIASAHDIVYISDARGAPTSEFFVSESAGTTAVYAKRCCHASYPSSVNIASAAGTATPAQDYEDAAKTIDFASATGIGALDLPFIDDSVEEGLENVEVSLSEPSQGMTLAAGGKGSVTIVDDDGPGRLSFARSSYQTFENIGYVELVVVRSGIADQPASVDYATLDGSAAAGIDYQSEAGTLDFAPGQRTRRVDLRTLDDRDREGTETFSVELSGWDTAEIVVKDDETPESDTGAPISYFHQPLHDTTYRAGRMRDILAFAEDEGAGVTKVQIGLMMKRAGGGCRWFSRADRRFIPGPCTSKKWMSFPTSETVVYTLPDLLRKSIGTKIRFYKAWSRGIDELGNVEESFQDGRNRVRFEIR